MKLYLDTNVLIDFYAQREPYFRDALRFQIMAEFGDAELWASAKSVTDLVYVLRKNCPQQKLLAALKAGFEVLHLCALYPEDIEQAIESEWPDFEDAIIHQAAINVGADYIITRDETGFIHSKIPVATPAKFFDDFKQNTGISYDDIPWESF